MSRSRPNEFTKNPAVRTLEWRGSEGHWKWYDKEKKEKMKQVGLRIAVLDELSGVGGYSDAHQCNFFSNEVHSTKREPLTVKFFPAKGKLAVHGTGLYEDLKANLPAGIGYVKVVYALDLDTGDIIRLALSGSATPAWINMTVDKHGAVIQAETEDGKKGAVKFKIPIFTGADLSADEEQKAIEADKRVQNYLDEQKARTGIEAEAADDGNQQGPPLTEPPAESDDIPF